MTGRKTARHVKPIVEILIDHSLTFCILTKGANLAMRDFELLQDYPKVQFGVTLTIHRPENQIYWELDADGYFYRRRALMVAHYKVICSEGIMKELCECAHWVRVDLTAEGMTSKHHPDCPKNKLIKIYTITPGKGLAPCTEDNPDAIKEWLDQAEPGDVLQIVVGEIEQWKYDEMPEYMGP